MIAGLMFNLHKGHKTDVLHSLDSLNYLGDSNVNTMSTRAEHCLETVSFAREKQNWNFEKYVKLHADQHAILEGLVEYGHARIDERLKVHHLLRGIKMDKLDSVKSTIYANATYHSDFNVFVNLYKTLLDQLQNQSGGTPSAHITAVKHTYPKGADNTDMSVKDMFYKEGEYKKLTLAQKMGLTIKHEK